MFASVPAHTRVVADWDYGIPVKIYETHRTTKDEVQKMQNSKSRGLVIGAGIIAGATANKLEQFKPSEALKRKWERERLEKIQRQQQR